MSVSEYYDNYWTADGFDPQAGSGLPSEVASVYRSRVAGHHRVLDLGCGNGRASGRILTDLAAEYVGVDISRTALEAARQLGLNVQPIEDAAELPFEDGSFDFGTCIEVFEHLFRPDHAAAELARVLRPGATAVITVPNVAFWRRRADLALLGRWHPFGDDLAIEQPWRDPHIRFFTADALSRMLEASGFEDVEVRGHDGAVLREIPILRRLGKGGVSATYRRAQASLPGLLGARLHAVARRADV